jgi:non-ribosomal peptide synthetase component F
MSQAASPSATGSLFASSPEAFFARIAASRNPSLSYSEEFLWWSSRLAGDSTFNVRVVLRLRGAWNVGALQDSVVEVARRHETLRTAFPMENGAVVRRLLPAESARPSILDLPALDPATRQADAWRLVLEEANRPFNLRRGPLFRSRILRLSDEEHLLQFTIHHIVIDGRSVDILLGELGTIYRAYVEGRGSPLSELRAQYAEHAAKMRQRLDGGAIDKALSYWRAQLDGSPSLLDLPADGPRRAARHYPGRTISFAFTADQSSAIRELARRHGTTVFVVLLGVLKILLHRWSGSPSVAVETPLASRRSIESEALIGLLVDLVPLRTDMSDDPSLPDLLARVRRTTLGAFDHAGVPIHVLVPAVNAHVDASHAAICQVMFNLINMQSRGEQLQALGAEQVPLPDSPHSKFDMMLTAHSSDTLRFQLLYRRDLFSEPRMREFVEQFRMLVDQALTAPDKRIAQYSLVTPASSERLRPSSTPADEDIGFGDWIANTFPVPAGARVGVLPGVSDDVLLQATTAATRAGGTVCVANDPAGGDLRAWLGEAIVAAYGTVEGWRRVRRHGDPISSLKYAFFTGGVLLSEDVARVRALAPGVTCVNVFTCRRSPGRYACHTLPPGADDARAIVPIGHGVAGADLLVLNRHNQLAGVGELGELHFQPARTTGPHALLATGMMGRFLPDGSVDCVGDGSAVVSVNGYTIRVDEVAAAVMRHSSVLDARVTAETGREGTQLVAHVTLADHAACSEEDLDRFVRQRVAAFMAPRRFVRACPAPV